MNFLPGWHPGFFAAGADQAANVVFVDSATSSTSTITAPADIQAGDLLVIASTASDDDGSPPSLVTPAGFTLATDETASFGSKASFRLTVHYKEAVGTEGGVAFNVMSSSDPYYNPDQNALMGVWRRTPAATTITLQDAENTSGGGVGTITASGGVTPLVAIAVGSQAVAAAGDPAVTMTPTRDGTIDNMSADNQIRLAYKVYNDMPANITLTDAISFFIHTMYFEMT